MKEITVEELKDNIFNTIGKDWLLITTNDGTKTNMMTASWGALGVYWGKPTATIYVRRSRYTKEALDKDELFTLCVLTDDKKDAHKVCGSQSGRDMDKVKETGLTVEHVDGVPYFKESRLVLVCRKIFSQIMEDKSFNDREGFNKWYGDGNLHSLYMAEIQKVLIKE